MKRSMKKVFASSLAVLLSVTMLPLASFAANVDIDLSKDDCDYYNLIEKNDYALAPGALESEIVLNDSTGGNRNVLHVIEVDLTNDNISVMPTYKGLEEGIDFEDSTIWAAQKLTEQAAHVEEDLGLNVVGGINTNLRYGNNHPYGVLVWNGVVYSDERSSSGVSTAQTFLSVTKEGVASLHSASEPIPDDAWNAISANFGWIIKDGVSQYTTDDHTDANRAPRTVIGIKEDGTLVLMMNDGRQSPYSAGTTMKELAEILLSLGCVDAVNCDGGGSSTFISEREGTGELTMKSSPSDGGQRATLGGLLVISKAVADGKFHHATVKSTEQYVTPNSTVEFTATGADSAGGPADIPTDGSVTWKLADSSYGTVENGVFVSSGKTGEAVVQMVYNGEVVGEDSVNVVIPESIEFTQENITVPFGKTAELTIKATVNNGLNEVTLKDGDIDFALSDEAMGSIKGFSYTACGEDAGVSSGTITATLVFDTSKTDVANLNLGKGSEVVWDFENGDISALSFGTGYGSKHKNHPELGRFEEGYIEVVDSTTGQVKNGDKALAVVCDWSGFYAMGYNMLRLSGLGVDMTDAVGVGFWAYITPEATGAEFDLNNAIPFNSGDAGSDAYPEDGWYYIYAAKDDGVGETFNNLSIYHTDGYDSATNENIANIKTKHTIYIDDITVDYSTVVEDREAPKFSSVAILKDADTYEEMGGQTVTTNTVTVMAEAKEDTTKNNYTGLDTSSAKVYVDGVQLTSGVVCASNGSISIDNINLEDGIHTFRIEIADNAGNYRSITRQIVVDANDEEAAITYVPKNPELNNLPIGSIYWMDLKAAEIENVESISVELDLDGMNDWQLEHMEVAQGFSVKYSIDEFTNDATLEITKTGKVKATGNETVVSIPIRVWEFTRHLEYPECVTVCKFLSLPSTMWAGDGSCRIAICTSVARGEVTFADETENTFSSEKYVVNTELNKHRNLITQTEKDAKTSWHIHTPVATEDKAPTCTETGYTGRTVCAGCSCGNTEDNPCDTFDGCGSVVDWGTTIPATGHTYTIVDGKIACECGEVLETTGLYTLGEETYYAINGKLSTGWIFGGEGYYYFDTTTYAAKRDGVYKINGYNYTFDAQGFLQKGQLVNVFVDGEIKTKYMYAGKSVYHAFAEIDGNKYWFDDYGYMVKGTQILQIAAGTDAKYIYVISDDGVFEGVLDYTGVYELDGVKYAVEAGKISKVGICEFDGSIYYADKSNGKIKTGKIYVDSSCTNGLVTTGWHYFAEDGHMYDEEFVEIDGNLRYMVDGQFSTNGIFEREGKLYYAEWTGVVQTGKQYIDSASANGLTTTGWHYFAEDGHMYDNEISEIDGNLHFMVDGNYTTNGIFEYEGKLYFAEWTGILQTGKQYIDANCTNGLTTTGWHYFAEDGHMYDKESAEVDGVLHYFVDGKFTTNGIFERDGKLYFAEWTGILQTGKQYIDSANANGLTTTGWHYFAEDGHMYDNEIVEIDGNLRYMVDGKFATNGIFEHEGKLYFAEWTGILQTGKQYIDANCYNGLTTKGWHYFAEDGHMYDNEIVEIDGYLRYMVDGRFATNGIFEYEGKLYFAEWTGILQTGKQYIDANCYNGLTTKGWHYFAEDGHMYDNEIVEIDGNLRYMVDGRFATNGIFEYEGKLYFAEWTGILQTGKQYIDANCANGLTTTGTHYFAEDGHMYHNEFVEIDGVRRYMINGAFMTTGMFEHEGSLYFADWSGEILTGKIYVDSASSNGLTSTGWHYCDETGRMYDEEFAELDGNLYYMVDGTIAKLGVFEYGGNLYYSDTWSGIVSRDTKTYITTDATNDLIIYGWHEFDANGVMIN